MNYKLLIISLAVAMVGCSKSDIPQYGAQESTDSAIQFRSEDNWGDTKAMVTTPNNFTQMDVYAYYTKGENFTSDASVLTPFMYDQQVERQAGAAVWNYSPIKYWPNNTGDKVSFFAFAPTKTTANDVVVDITAAGDKYPTFSYQHKLSASNTLDVSYDTQFDKSKEVDGTGVHFEMERLMTRVNIFAGCINKPSEEDFNKIGESEVDYYIDRVVFYDVKSKIDYVYDLAKKSYEWKLDESKSVETYSALNGQILLGVDYTKTMGGNDYVIAMYENAIPEVVEGQKDQYKDMSPNNKGILFLPQATDGMTMQVFVVKRYKKLKTNKKGKYTTNQYQADEVNDEVAMSPPDDVNNVNTYDDTYAIYEEEYPSAMLTVPSPNGEGFKSANWVKMYFTFDIVTVTEFGDIKITATVQDWDDATVTVPSFN